MVLPEGLVGQNGHRVAEIQAAGLLPHGQADAAVIVLPAKGLRQPRRFLAEKQPAVRGELGPGIVPRRLGGGKPQVVLCLRVQGEQCLQAFIVAHPDQVPVVQTRPAHGALGYVKAQGADQMQPAAGGGAGAGDIAAVLRDLRLDEDDVQHGTAPFCAKCRGIFLHFTDTLPIVMQRKWKFNRKMGFFANYFFESRFFRDRECKIPLIFSRAAVFFSKMKNFFLFLGKTLDFTRNAGIMKGKTERKGSVVPWDADSYRSAFPRGCFRQTADAAACSLLRRSQGGAAL